MCGITGYHGFSDDIDIEAMVERLSHRGPDSSGIYTDRSVGLGSRRLSIVGKGNGNQPIHNEEETVWTVFNGEIYNYEELREKLRSRDHRFYTGTDTEVIVHAYEEWGEKCFEKFQGMYAIAIWDADSETFLLARDTLGKKPLYYHERNAKIVFGSEIKSLLAAGIYEPSVKTDSLDPFLAYGYTSGSSTLFDGIKKLRPGEIVKVRDREISRGRIRSGSPYRVPRDIDDAAEMLRGILREDIEKWTRENGSYGLFLSGGIDSVSVLSLLSDMDVDVRAYTASFPGSKFDETRYAEKVSSYYGVEHEVIEVSPNAINIVPELVAGFDDLVADQGSVPYYLLAEEASEHSRVAFTGSGSDELFGGYEHHHIMDMGDRFLGPVPRKIRAGIPHIAKRVPDRVIEKFFPYVRELGPAGWRRFSEYLDNIDSAEESYETINAVMTREEIGDLLGRTVKDVTDTDFDLTAYRDRSAMRWGMAYEQQVQLPNRNLMKNDKTGMAHGLEIRSPLLTERTTRFSRGMPDSLLRGGAKRVLKRAMAPDLPDNVVERKKQRLLMPIHEWLREDGAWTVEELEERYGIPPMMDEEVVADIVDGLDTSPLYYSRQLWNVAHFITWYDRYISRF